MHLNCCQHVAGSEVMLNFCAPGREGRFINTLTFGSDKRRKELVEDLVQMLEARWER